MFPLCTKYLSRIDFHFLSHRKKFLFSFSASLLPSDLYLGQSSDHWIQWPWLKQACLIRIPNVYFVLFTSFQRTSPSSSLCEVFCNLVRFHGAHSPSTKLEDHSLSVIRSCCSYMEAAFSIGNLKMRHVVVANLYWFIGECNVHCVNWSRCGMILSPHLKSDKTLRTSQIYVCHDSDIYVLFS